MTLTEKTRERYRRQLPVIGEEGQDALNDARVLIAGIGGLGSLSALYLAAAGVGHIRIVDDDRVELTNLNRQILHSSADIGRSKVISAREKLRALNPHIVVEALSATIDEKTVDSIVEGMNLIIDGADSFTLRYLLNKAALQLNIPFIHGAVYGFNGQATTVIPHRSACLRCIFPTEPTQDAETSVIGSACGIISSIEVAEAIKCLTGMGDLLANRLLLWDGMRGDVEIISVAKDNRCPSCGDGRLEVAGSSGERI